MNPKYNQSTLVDLKAVLADKVTNDLWVDVKLFDDKRFINNVFLKLDITALKNSDTDEIYQVQVWGSDDNFVATNIPLCAITNIDRDFLVGKNIGDTIFIPLVDFNYMWYGLEVGLGGTNPSITYSASLVKNIKKIL